MGELNEIAFYHDRCCICLTKYPDKRAPRKRLTCGNRCRQRLHRLRHPELPAKRRLIAQHKRKLDPTVCRMCGKDITQPAVGRRRIYHSDVCRKKASRLRYGRCRYCKESFPRNPSTPNQIFCKEECRVKQNIIDAWPKELARRLKRAPDYDWSRQRGTPYRFEKLPDGAETHQPPDWWVELRYKNWLNARKRRNQRFSKPPKWREERSTEDTEEDEEQIGSWQPVGPKRDPGDVHAEKLRYIKEKLASVGITLEKPYNDMKPDEIEAVWLEYERRVRERNLAA